MTVLLKGKGVEMDEPILSSENESTVDVVQYKLQLNPLASSKAGRNIYNGVVIKKETYGTRQLTERMVNEQTPLNASTIRMVIDDLANLIAKLASEGRAINLGGVIRIMPVIHGTFDSLDEPWNPKKHKVRISACAGTKLRNAAVLSPVMRLDGLNKPEILQVTNVIDPAKPKFNQVPSAGEFVVVGHLLTWDRDAADEGWFLNYKGQETKCEVVKSENPHCATLRTTCVFDNPGESLLLIFRTRLNGEKSLQQFAYGKPLETA